ncbi:MAG: mechanosensitive ion channel [Candidatus Zixiibacteriota bacterium]
MTDFWNNVIVPAFEGIVKDIIGVLPKLAGALAILVIGWIIAKIISKIVSKLLRKIGFNSIAEKAGIAEFLIKSGFKRDVSWVVGRLAFWTIMMMFLLSAAEALKLTALANSIQQVVSYIPNLIVIILVLVFGMLVSRLVTKITTGAAASAGIEFADFLGKLVGNFILAAVVVIAISQLEIQSQAIDYVFIAILGALGVAIALALGLGSRTIAQSIINGIYARKIFKIGSNVKIDDIEGELIQIGNITSLLRTKKGVISIPNSQLNESTVFLPSND